MQKQRNNQVFEKQNAIYLIDGYLRHSEALLSSKNIFSNIPFGVNNICLMYYFIERDEWDPQCIGQSIKLKENDCLVKYDDDYAWNSAFGKMIISNGLFKWKFKIEKCETEGWSVVIGIWKIKSEETPPINTYFTHLGDIGAYGYVSDAAQLVSNSGGGYRLTDGPNNDGKYGIHCRTGDIVEMHLNMNQLTLSYSINDKYHGIAFKNIENTPYRMAVNLKRLKDSIRML